MRCFLSLLSRWRSLPFSPLRTGYSTYLYDISAIALLLLPLTLANALTVLSGQALSYAHWPAAAAQLFHLSDILINLYPLALCVVISYYLSHKTSFNSAAFILYALTLLYVVSGVNGLFAGTLHLPNNPLLAMLSAVITLLFCRCFRFRELQPQSADFALLLLRQVGQFLLFCLLALWVAALTRAGIALFTGLLSHYRPDPLTLSGGLMYQFILGALGSVGINGHNFLLSVKQMLFAVTQENLAAWQAGQAPLHTISQGFYDAFLSMGGSGNSISLLLCILLFSRDRKHLMLAFAALPMVLFNINEVLLFGLPIIFNPLLIIPFIGVPLVSFVLAYLAISYGWVSPVVTIVDWMTPPLLSGYLAMGEQVSGALLQLLLIVVGTALYRPFYLAFAGQGQRMGSAVTSGVERVTFSALLAEMRASAQASLQRANAQRRVTRILRTGALVMHYQRQHAVQGEAGHCFEALLRYRDANGLLHGPAFVADFKLLDAMPALDRRVVDLVLADLQRLPAAPNVRVSVNISARTISQAEFVPYLAGRLAHFGIAPTRLEIEITEEAALDNRSQLLDTMQALQAMGCQVAMDDFGAGFASFPHLMKYPFDKVKLDRSLLLDCTAPKGRELYRLLVQIGQLAHCQVVAEGVETEQELAFVSECGVDRVQGFLIARPQPLEAVSAFLRAAESDLL